MNTKEILYESIIEIKKLLSKKEISALELTKLSLERIEETNNKTNAFLYVAENEALEDAKKIDKKLADGENIGPLGGIPTSIKDLVFGTARRVPKRIAETPATKRARAEQPARRQPAPGR